MRPDTIFKLEILPNLENPRSDSEVQIDFHVEAEGQDLEAMLFSFFVVNPDMIKPFGNALKGAIVHNIANGIRPTQSNLNKEEKKDNNDGF